jgi:integrase
MLSTDSVPHMNLGQIPSVWWTICMMSPAQSSPMLPRVIAECLSSKRAAKKRECYVKQLGWSLERFLRFIGEVPIGNISPQDLERFLASQPNGSRNTMISRLQALFGFAFKRGLIQTNPTCRIECAVVDQKPARILSPEQTKQLLDACSKHDPSMVPPMAVGFFVGARPSEISKLTWPDIDLDRGLLTVSAAASKVRRRRIVPLQPTAVTWLRPFAKRIGPVQPKSYAYRRDHIMEHLPWNWSHDLARHTAASMLLAKFQDPGKVSMWLGNSVQVLMQHYFELVPPDDCQKFWEIRP